jgi:hypothetical protein
VPDVLPAPALGQGRHRRRGQAKGIVQLAIREQAGVGGDLGPVELELDAAVEGDPQRLLRFTRRVRHDQPIRPLLCI